MNTNKGFKLNSRRPKSSAKAREVEVQNLDVLEKRSKIPIMPKRTYSLDWKGSYIAHKKNSQQQSSTTSMIPRLDRKKYVPKTPERGALRPKGSAEKEKRRDLKLEGDVPKPQTPSREMDNNCERKLSQEFIQFKKNVLKIPEFWTDTGSTVTNILKNAENVITKKYPTADMKMFEMELRNIQNATKAAKDEIVLKAERIIDRANEIYYAQNGAKTIGEEEMRRFTKNFEEMSDEVQFDEEESLKYDGDVMQREGLQKIRAKTPKERSKSVVRSRMVPDMKEEVSPKRAESRKAKCGSPEVETKKQGNGKMVMQSCGDGQDNVSPRGDHDLGKENKKKQEEKSTQTVNILTAELCRRDEAFNLLNNQILELQNLCNENMSKFKNFNLQIKLRGMCGKGQNSTQKEAGGEDKTYFSDSNAKLLSFVKDLQSVIKQKEADLHQKEKIIHQQKKLLLVRDELIDMLKSKL